MIFKVEFKAHQVYRSYSMALELAHEPHFAYGSDVCLTWWFRCIKCSMAWDSSNIPSSSPNNPGHVDANTVYICKLKKYARTQDQNLSLKCKIENKIN